MGKMTPMLFNETAFSFTTLRPLFSSSISPSSDDLSSTADKICHLIRRQPRWESTLLSHFPLARLAHAPLLTAVITSPSIASNPLLSLRFFIFISSHQITIPSSLTPCLSKCLAHLCTPKSTNHIEKSISTFTKLIASFQFVPHISICNADLAACLRACRTDLLFTLYQFMNMMGVFGDESTAGYIIQAFCKEEKLLDAYRALREFTRNGVLPNVPSISILVAAFAKIGNYGMVSELLHLMIAGKRMPDIYTYQSIIHGLCDNGMGDEGLRIFNELKMRGYHVDVVTYSTMIDGLGKMGKARQQTTVQIEHPSAHRMKMKGRVAASSVQYTRHMNRKGQDNNISLVLASA